MRSTALTQLFLIDAEVRERPLPGGPTGALRGESTSTTTRVDGLDQAAWLAWSRAGLQLFARRDLPTLRETTGVARAVLISLAAARSRGNISQMARWLNTSRRIVREALRALALYRGERSAGRGGQAEPRRNTNGSAWPHPPRSRS